MSAAVTETCACGATITVATRYTSDARRALDEWREGHKHAESVGICADRPEWNLAPDFPSPFCVLKAGHDGAHADDKGGHWVIAARTPAAPEVVEPSGGVEA